MGNLCEYRSLRQDSGMKIPDDRSIPDLIVSTSLCVATSWTSSDVAKKFRNLAQSGGNWSRHIAFSCFQGREDPRIKATCVTGRQSGLKDIILSLGEPTSLEVCNCFQRGLSLFAMMVEFDQ